MKGMIIDEEHDLYEQGMVVDEGHGYIRSVIIDKEHDYEGHDRKGMIVVSRPQHDYR